MFFHRGQWFRWSSPVKLCTGTLEQQHLNVPLSLLLSHNVITPLSSSLLFHSSLLLTAAPNVSLVPLSLSLTHSSPCVLYSHLLLRIECGMPKWHWSSEEEMMMMRLTKICMHRCSRLQAVCLSSSCSSLGLRTGKGLLGLLCPLVAGRAPHSYCSLCHCNIIHLTF